MLRQWRLTCRWLLRRSILRLLRGSVVRLAGGRSIVGGRAPLWCAVHCRGSALGSTAAVGRGSPPLVHGRGLVLLRGAVLLRRPACTAPDNTC